MRNAIKKNRILVLAGCMILLAASAAAQEGMAVSLQKKFNSFSQKAFQEKIFLHADKQLYVAGEIVWFKVYCVDDATRQASDLSKVTYVEIVSSDAKSVLQGKIAMEAGHGKGSFYLPVSLNSGRYRLRAYTNWMKNFDAGYYFEKEITIINTLKSPEATMPADTNGAVVDFFPEGGHLVAGIQSTIGFKGTDNQGRALDFTGLIIGDQGDTVLGFSPSRFGMGSFLLRPVEGHTYKAIIQLAGGKILRTTFPEIEASGYVIHLQDNGTATLRVVIYKKSTAARGTYERILLAANTRQVLHFAEEKTLDATDSVQFTIEKSRLGKGITNLTLFNSNFQPVCERLYFQKPDAPLPLTVAADKENYAARSEVNLSITSSASQGVSPLNLSAAIVELDSIQGKDESTIFNYMWLGSDLKGRIDSPGFYFSDEEGATAAADNLMLTQGWRRFRWDAVLNDPAGFIKFLPEYNGHLVTGRIVDKKEGKPLGGVNAFLSLPGRHFGFYVAKSDADGVAQFDVKDFYGPGTVITRPDLQADSLYKVEILSPFVKANPDRAVAYELNPAAREQLLRRSIGMQVQNIYTADELRKAEAPYISDTLPFYGHPEATYKLDEFKRFISMEEVLREYITQINVVSRGGKLELKMIDPQSHGIYEGNVLVLLDGVPLTNVNRIFSYDPLKIRKLDIIQSRYIMGAAVWNGMASFSTYDGNFDGYSLDPALISIDYDGLQLQREFYSPVYTTKEQLDNRIPDFRSTLLWDPEVNLQSGHAKLRLFTSDRKGKFAVIVQGMNEKGSFVAARTVFEVK